jgi:hypothetical protein
MELCGRELSGNFAEMTTSTPFRYLLHAANLRCGTDGFTSPPKEGVLRNFSHWKILTASARFEPANLGTWRQHATPRPPTPLICRTYRPQTWSVADNLQTFYHVILFSIYLLFAYVIYFMKKCPYDLLMFSLYVWSLPITLKLNDKFSKRLVPLHHHHFILNKIKMYQNDRHNIFWT